MFVYEDSKVSATTREGERHVASVSPQTRVADKCEREGRGRRGAAHHLESSAARPGYKPPAGVGSGESGLDRGDRCPRGRDGLSKQRAQREREKEREREKKERIIMERLRNQR